MMLPGRGGNNVLQGTGEITLQFPPNAFLLPSEGRLGCCCKTDEICPPHHGSESNQLCSILEVREGPRQRVPPTPSSSLAPLPWFHPAGTVPPTLPSQLTLSSRVQSSGWPSLAPLRLLPERLWGRKYQLENRSKGREERRASVG